MMAEQRCRICNQDEQWHKEHRPRHEFSPDSTIFRQASPETDKKKLPSDPVLRLLLIRKGVITADELGEIEKELASAGVIVVEPRGGGADKADRGGKRATGGMRLSGKKSSG